MASWDVVLSRFTWTFVRMPTTSVRDAIPNWGHSGGYNRPQLPNAMPYILKKTKRFYIFVIIQIYVYFIDSVHNDETVFFTISFFLTKDGL